MTFRAVILIIKKLFQTSNIVQCLSKMHCKLYFFFLCLTGNCSYIFQFWTFSPNWELSFSVDQKKLNCIFEMFHNCALVFFFSLGPPEFDFFFDLKRTLFFFFFNLDFSPQISLGRYLWFMHVLSIFLIFPDSWKLTKIL